MALVPDDGEVGSVGAPEAWGGFFGVGGVEHVVEGDVEFAGVAAGVPFDVPCEEVVTAVFVVGEVVSWLSQLASMSWMKYSP